MAGDKSNDEKENFFDLKTKGNYYEGMWWIYNK